MTYASQDLQKILAEYQLSVVDILENAPCSIILTDAGDTIIFWNAYSEELFGYPAGEVLGQPLSLIAPKPERSDPVSPLQQGKEAQYWRAHGGKRIRVRFKTKDMPGEGDQPGARIWYIQNLEEQEELERGLQESRARAQAILDHTVEAVITIDTRGIIQSFNRSAERIFGYSEAEVVGQNVKMLMPHHHRVRHDAYIRNYLETGERKIIGMGREERGRRKDGSVFPMELSVSEVRWDNERIFTGIVRDISRRRKLENEILEISEEERRRIGQDLHDGLGQMLTGIGLISQNVAKKLEANGLPGAEEVREISQMIKEADEYARSLSHTLVPIDVDEEGLRHALTQLARRARKLFDIDCSFEENGPVRIEKKNISLHLYRIAQEAINNAVKHGGAESIGLKLVGGDEYIRLIIEDDGDGFPDGAPNPDKKGLGVHTMRHRAHIMGGELTIDSENGCTKVICRIPYHKAQQNEE